MFVYNPSWGNIGGSAPDYRWVGTNCIPFDLIEANLVDHMDEIQPNNVQVAYAFVKITFECAKVVLHDNNAPNGTNPSWVDFWCIYIGQDMN